ncbi:hypothetical protein G2W53_026568 [Senna tora]|uniref:Uncharacterized protein n=1 Tax=Senna tora TaxID=362788 RepID=A0A834TF95_9FABA|nr:hypothetical protein G2W53_026568 [Senna tora]
MAERPSKKVKSGKGSTLSQKFSQLVNKKQGTRKTLQYDQFLKGGGNTSNASVVEQFAMYCIVTNTKFNIPSLMIKRMMRCTRATNVSLPYASLVTLILWKHKINPHKGEIKNPIPIDGNCVSRSGHTKYINSWVPKDNRSQRRKRMEVMEADEALVENLGTSHTFHSEGFSSQATPQVSSNILSAIRSLQATVDRCFDAVQGRFDTMTSHFQALELTATDHTTAIKDIQIHLDNMF